MLNFFTSEGLAKVYAKATSLPEEVRTASVNFFLDSFTQYQATITSVIAFLQGRDSTLSHRINSREFLPEGPRFQSLEAYDDEETGDPLAWAFGALGSHDRARHFATLYLNDLSDVLRDAVDDRFEFVRYAESLASSQPTFTPLANALEEKPSLLDLCLQELSLASICLLYTSPSPRDRTRSRMPSSA